MLEVYQDHCQEQDQMEEENEKWEEIGKVLVIRKIVTKICQTQTHAWNENYS